MTFLPSLGGNFIAGAGSPTVTGGDRLIERARPDATGKLGETVDDPSRARVRWCASPLSLLPGDPPIPTCSCRGHFQRVAMVPGQRRRRRNDYQSSLCRSRVEANIACWLRSNGTTPRDFLSGAACAGRRGYYDSAGGAQQTNSRHRRHRTWLGPVSQSGRCAADAGAWSFTRARTPDLAPENSRLRPSIPAIRL